MDSIETVSGLQSVFEAAAHAVAAGRGEGLLVGGVPASAVLASAAGVELRSSYLTLSTVPHGICISTTLKIDLRYALRREPSRIFRHITR